MKLNIRVVFAAFCLTLGTVAGAVSIWNSTGVTPSATDRIPVDVSSSGAPSHITVADLDAYIGANPGGSNTYVQFNDSSAFGGDAGFTFNETNDTINLGGATLTASDPVLDLTQTWNSGAVTFTGLKLDVTDTASAAASLLLDLRVGGNSQFAVRKNGYIDVPANTVITPASGALFVGGQITIGSTAYTDRFGLLQSTRTMRFPDGGAAVITAGGNILEQRNSTVAQTLRVYDTYTDASNYGRLALNAGAAGDWVQIAAETAGAGADNYGIALTPSGTGAISAHVPDSTAAGGNARGANAVDLQTVRASAAQSATGAYSTIAGGQQNTASGANSVTAGIQNTASGEGSVALGAVGTASGANSFAFGAGSAATASGIASIALGYGVTASGQSSFAWGRDATTRGLLGATAYAVLKRSNAGDAQVILQPVRRTTTDATPVSLAADGTPAAATVMVLPASSTLMCDAMVVAQSGAGTDNAGYKVSAVIQRDASNNTALVGSATTTTVGEDTAGMDATIVANDTLESAEIQVTGVAATTIHWVGELKCVQVL